MCHEMGIVVAWLHHKLCTTLPPSFYHALRPPSSIRLAKESPSRLATWPRFTASLAAACRLLANFLQRNFGDASVPPADTATCRAPAFRSTACHSHFGLDFARIFQLHYFSQQWNRKEVENLQRRCPPARCEAVRLDVWQSGCVAFSHVATSLNLITNPRRGSL